MGEYNTEDATAFKKAPKEAVGDQYPVPVVIQLGQQYVHKGSGRPC